MNEGLIEQSGTPEQIYEYPATPFVARFVGFDNRIDGILTELKSNAVHVDVHGVEFISTRPSPNISKEDEGKSVSLFFRPDDTLIGVQPGKNACEVTIDFSNYQGNTTQYAMHFGEHPLRAVVLGKPVADNTEHTVFSIPPNKVIVEKGGR
jgi:ABC-type Fe3+/spermidine/putrescine transport system ATPase subunit